MSSSLVILVLMFLGLAICGGYLFVKRRQRQQKISDLTAGIDLLAHWTYTPNEWEPVAEEFSWRGKGAGGEVYVSPTAIYLKSESTSRLVDLASEGKVVTYASHLGIEGSPLKIRVRWKIVRRYDDRPDEVKYYKEDYRIPVPPRYTGEAKRVADFFTARLQANLDAYTAVVADDEPISLFGKDAF